VSSQFKRIIQHHVSKSSLRVQTNTPCPSGLKAPTGPQRSTPEPTRLTPARSFKSSVKSILLWEPPTAPLLQAFEFDVSLDAIQHNWLTFESLERSLEKPIDLNSIMAYGSEFKPLEILAPLLDSTSLCPYFRMILECGSELSRERGRGFAKNYRARRSRGNHKSARRRLCSSLYRRRHTKVQLATFQAFHSAIRSYPPEYYQRAQRDRLEETPHSRLDIRSPRYHSLLQKANQDGRSSVLAGPSFGSCISS
jgi:hypothetical protein